MDHFEIVLALCRAASQGGNPAVLNHIRRLTTALRKAGQEDEAAQLAKLERGPDAGSETLPSRVVMSFALQSREVLSKNVKPPVDRETSAPLAEIVFPEPQVARAPLFSSDLAESIQALLDEWRNVDRLEAFEVAPAMSVMLFGEPGTGKTMLAHHVAAELGLPMVVARLDGLISSFLGTTARNISNLFAFADRYRCVLLLDEFDALAKLRDDPNELGELKRVVNTLLQCLDSRAKHGFTLAVTNHQGLLDPAVWRRFDIRIQIPKPTTATRLGLITRHFGEAVALTPPQAKFLGWLTSGHSGADIQRLAEFVKRQFALRGPDVNLVDLSRRYVQMSAHDSESENRMSALGETADIAFALANDPDVNLGQEELAQLFGKGQATISRWLKDRRTSRGRHAQ